MTTVPENPFALPGEVRDNAPLNPLRHETHLGLYVPVDNTQGAFEEFCDRFADPGYLRLDGRLVVTAGGRGCGKSSLINRCAHWLQDQMRTAAQLTAVVVDVTRGSSIAESMAARRARVYAALLDKLYANKTLIHDLAYQQRHSPDEALRTLPNCLDEHCALIVLLPSTELVDELVQYTQDVGQRMVFFAETTAELSNDHRLRMDQAGAIPPVHLQVGRLDSADAGVFASERLHPLRDVLPPVAKTALEELISRRLVSIGEVQRLLYGVYAQLRVQNVLPKEVTYQHISDHYVKHAADLLETRP